ncbi:SpoIIE family protein phosphatase, partial [Vibrio sp. 2025]
SIWCFSDGVVEARYDNEFFSVNRLIANVQSVSGLPFEAQVSSVVESIKRWQVKEDLDDDLTLLQLQWSGPNTSTCEGEDD